MDFEEAAQDPAKFPFAGTSSSSPHFSPPYFIFQPRKPNIYCQISVPDLTLVSEWNLCQAWWEGKEDLGVAEMCSSTVCCFKERGCPGMRGQTERAVAECERESGTWYFSFYQTSEPRIF